MNENITELIKSEETRKLGVILAKQNGWDNRTIMIAIPARIRHEYLGFSKTGRTHTFIVGDVLLEMSDELNNNRKYSIENYDGVLKEFHRNDECLIDDIIEEFINIITNEI